MPNSSSYDIINGRKYKKCKPNQIRNPLTNRCVNIKNNKCVDKKVAKIESHKSPIKPKIKTCPEGKVLNPKTNRCIKIKVVKDNKKPKTIKDDNKKPKINSKTKAKAKTIKDNKKPNLFKKLFYPFINRVNANINDRIKYYKLLMKTLDIDESKNYCMKLYKYDANNNPIYRLGNKIVLKKQIGTESAYGIIYLSSFRDTYNKIFKYATKIMLNTNDNNKEIMILKDLTKAVLNNKCPHFPILYASLKCDRYNRHMQSSYVKSSDNKIQKNQIDDIKNYPKLIRDNYNKNNIIFALNELANGDLKTFLEKYHMDFYLLQNALVQIYLSLLFFYQESKCFHTDCHWGNFLYHKVKPGGYFHYIIFDRDYYLENLGFLWVVWDFGLAKSFKTLKGTYEYINVCSDLLLISSAFFNFGDYIIPTQMKVVFRLGEWMPYQYKINNRFKSIFTYVFKHIFVDNFYIRLIDNNGNSRIKKYDPLEHKSLYKGYISYNHNIIKEEFKHDYLYHDYTDYSPENMNNMIYCIITTFKKYNFISTQIKDKTKIINKTPYVLFYFKD